ncbi:TlpA family protein disulfide reductase [Chromobacterium alticapitis]|uniref:Thioredoxin n=1 Tax=Chromobacterium alticapitis TaxID=2073169 RepID=A0A2S5DJK6_9NEIS|nr:TlpA disulfide reductase family protein [Chromobacterium alticapitis]POZ63256.1 thioredoxin [Chromobacterium alticapitis]
MKKGLLILVAVLAVAGIAYSLLFSRQPAPEVKLTSLAGVSTSTAALKGKVVLVNFWATSCPGCVEEMPEIKKLHQDYAGKGLNVLAVAMSYDPPNYVQSFVAKYQLPFFVALDTQGDVAKAFGDIQLAPTTFLIDKQGNIIKRYVGVMDFAEVRKLIEQHL